MPRKLPSQFQDLARFVDEWALANERDRYFAMLRQTPEQMMPFYRAMMSRIDEITAHLNGFDLRTMPEDAKTLFDLALTFVETGHPIDLDWPATDTKDSVAYQRLEFLGPSLGR